MLQRVEESILRFCLAALLLSGFCPAHLAAQGVPVIDMSAIQQAQQNLQMLQQQVQQLQSLANTAQGLARSIGQFGTPSAILQQSLSQSGVGQFSSGLIDGLSKTGLGAGVHSPDFATFDGARKWVNAATQVPANASASARSQGRQTRSMIAGETAADGYALALAARQQLGAQVTRAQNLANQIGSAGNLREDIAANTAVMLAIHDEMAEVQILLSALLATQSAARLAESDELQPTAAAAGAAQ